MKQLYKGKYLVVIYDRKGNIKRVMSDIPREQITFISHVFNGTIKANNVEFIDVFEEHDDCFSEEDKIFIDYLLKQEKVLCYNEEHKRNVMKDILIKA